MPAQPRSGTKNNVGSHTHTNINTGQDRSMADIDDNDHPGQHIGGTIFKGRQVWEVTITAKILKDLVKHGLINSRKDPVGGFFISYKTDSTSLLDILQLIEGNDFFQSCLLGLPYCSESKPCPAHFEYSDIKANFSVLFEKLNILELSKNLDQHKDLFRIRT